MSLRRGQHFKHCNRKQQQQKSICLAFFSKSISPSEEEMMAATGVHGARGKSPLQISTIEESFRQDDDKQKLVAVGLEGGP